MEDPSYARILARLQKLSQGDPAAFQTACTPEDAGQERWNRLLFSFLHKYLGTEPLYEDLPDPEPLLKIVLEGGNFGHHSEAREASLYKSPLRRKLGTAGLFLRRLPFQDHLLHFRKLSDCLKICRISFNSFI